MKDEGRDGKIDQDKKKLNHKDNGRLKLQ